MRKVDLAEALQRQLNARDAADSLVAAELMRAADLLNQTPDASGLPEDPVARELYVSLHSYRMYLLRQIRCSQELLWYQTESEGFLRSRNTFALAPALREFCAETELLTSGYAEMTTDDIPETLCAAIPPQRLSFVLLCLLTESLAQSPAYNALRFTVKEENGQIRITMCFSEGTASDKKTLPEPAWDPAQDAGLPASPVQIIRCFTETFNVRMLRQETDELHLCSLTLPAAERVTGSGRVESDRKPLPECPVSIYHAMLEAVIPPEDILLFDTRRL